MDIEKIQELTLGNGHGQRTAKGASYQKCSTFARQADSMHTGIEKQAFKKVSDIVRTHQSNIAMKIPGLTVESGHDQQTGKGNHESTMQRIRSKGNFMCTKID